MGSRRTLGPATRMGADPRLLVRRQVAEQLGMLIAIVILQGIAEGRPT